MNVINLASTIAIVGNHWFPNQPGGLDRYIYDLIHRLNGPDTGIHLYGIGLPEAESGANLRLTNLANPGVSLPKRLWSAQRIFRQSDFSQITAFNLHFTLYSAPLLPYLPADKPVVCTFHGPWAGESRQEGEHPVSVFCKRQVEQAVYRRCDRFIVLSKAFGEILHRQYSIPWEKIHVIPGGVNTQQFQPDLSRRDAREKLGWHLDRPILFTPRRLVQRMGLDKLLTAVAQVKQRVPEIWLAIAGKGSMRNQLEQQIQELDLSNHVQLLGFVPDQLLPVAYQAADLTVIPSQSLEGFGLVLLESLACGTPALCTPVGGMPEVLSPFAADLITESTEASAIAERLIEFFADQRALPTRPACTDYARTHFDWQAIAPRVRQVLLSR